jgi:hypothetical protein
MSATGLPDSDLGPVRRLFRLILLKIIPVSCCSYIKNAPEGYPQAHKLILNIKLKEGTEYIFSIKPIFGGDR